MLILQTHMTTPDVDAPTGVTGPTSAPLRDAIGVTGPTRAPLRDAIGTMTNRMITMAIDEMRRDETQQRIRSHLVDPLVKMMSQQMMPYVQVLFSLITAILLTTLMTFAMFAMSFFGRHAPIRP